RYAEFDGVVPKPQPRTPAGDNRRPHEPAIVENVNRFRQPVWFRAKLDDLAGSAASALALQSRPILFSGVNDLVGGPVLLHAALRRLIVEPADVTKNENRPAADAIEREPAMPVVNAIVKDPPIDRVIFRLDGIVPDELEVVVVDLDINAAYFVTRAEIGAQPYPLVGVTDPIVPHD